jgi:hypothetical protein
MGQTCFGQDQAPPVLLLICWGMEGVIRAKLHKNRAFPEDPVPRQSEDVEVVVIGGGESFDHSPEGRRGRGVCGRRRKRWRFISDKTEAIEGLHGLYS